MLRLLALDFDGVISDSAPEAFVVALRTYCELRSDAGFARREVLLGGGAPAPQLVEADSLYPEFLELMPLGNRAEDYAVALAALDSGTAIPDQSAYDVCKQGFDPSWLRAFHKRFYRVRAALSKKDPVAWQRLMGPYPAFLQLLRRRASEVVLAIATSKDRRSVRTLLRAYGIDDLFSEDPRAGQGDGCEQGRTSRAPPRALRLRLCGDDVSRRQGEPAGCRSSARCSLRPGKLGLQRLS